MSEAGFPLALPNWKDTSMAKAAVQTKEPEETKEGGADRPLLDLNNDTVKKMKLQKLDG